MAAPKSVWGIDIGQCALKAIKLREVEGQLQAEAFDVVEHAKILSEPDADREQLIRSALETFLSRNDVANSRLAVAVSGQTSFTKFVKMPPVDAKKIPDLVRFEAEQQIPFDINEVIWRWQAFPDPDSPDIEVGLFAIKQSDVYRILAPFAESMLDVDVVQMAPLALYNFMVYDHQTAEKGATLLIDIGADSTDLVVSDGPRLWTRTVQLGGNNFTEALIKAFKLSFAKAEKLKVTAATSKYARQVFQAMRPVFADLVQEIQRSIGYYTSLHRQSRFARVLGLGNGFRLPGLQKFLEQNLNMPVVRVDSFSALQLAPSLSAPAFGEHVLALAVAYGLGLQGLELTNVNTNLLPGVIASSRRWTKKRPWFAAAAAVVAVAALSVALRAWRDNRTLTAESSDVVFARGIQNTYTGTTSQFESARGQLQGADQAVKDLLQAYGYRTFWPHALDLISDAVVMAAPHQPYLSAGRVEELKRIAPDPKARQLMVVESLRADLIPNLSAPGATALTTAAPSAGGAAAAAGAAAEEMGEMGFSYAPAAPTPAQPAADSGATGKGFRFILIARTPQEKPHAMAMAQRFKDSLEKQAAAKYGGEIEYVDGKFDDWVTDGGGLTGRTGGMGGMGGMAGEMGDEGLATPMGGTPRAGAAGLTDIADYPLSQYNRFRMIFILKVKSDGLPPVPSLGDQANRE